MSLFNRKESPKKPIVPPISPAASKKPPMGGGSARNAPAPATQTVTLVAAKSVVQGEITGNAELVIEGRVVGDVRLESKVTVGQGGHVEGTIHAKTVIIGGKIEGDVFGREQVQLLASGRLEGDVISPGFEIEKGGFFKGQVDMSNTPPKKASGSSKGKDDARSQQASGKPAPGKQGGSGGKADSQVKVGDRAEAVAR